MVTPYPFMSPFLSIFHQRRVSLSGFHGDPVAVVLLLRRKKRVHERGGDASSDEDGPEV